MIISGNISICMYYCNVRRIYKMWTIYLVSYNVLTFPMLILVFVM